jgi:uncharacterized protein YkwD
MPVATPPPVAQVAAATQFDRAVVRHVNNVRRYAGLKPVVMTTHLRRMARHHTLDMLRHDSFSHNGDGTTFATRILSHSNYNRVGETLAFMPRHTSARRVVRAWLRSPGHRAVLLTAGFRRIGVCGTRGSMGRHGGLAVTADFASWR